MVTLTSSVPESCLMPLSAMWPMMIRPVAWEPPR